MKQTFSPVTDAAQFGQLHQQLIQTLGYGDLEDAMRECTQLADQDFARNFSAAAGPHSGPWAPRKRNGTGLERGEGHPLEIKTGEMFQAVTSPFGRGHIQDVGYRSAEIGVDPGEIPYAAAQNYGRSEINLPAREFADVSDGTIDRMTDIIADEVERLLAQ